MVKLFINNKISQMEVSAQWLRLEEHSNALNYLEMLKEFSLNIAEDPFYWKWIMISLHGAIYGFAISTIRGTNVDSVVNNKGRLISFDEALKRCQNKSWMQYALLNQVLALNSSQNDSIRIMKDIFRNEFMHFKPKGWSIEIHDFPIITLDCLEVLRFLGIQAYSGYRHNQNKQRKVKSIVFQCKQLIKKSDLYKETVQLINSYQT
jgi:hypothetical protein